MFWERFAQIIQWVSHLGSPLPVLKLQPSEFLDDWPMMMDGWTTPQSVMMMEKRRWWRCWSDKFDSTLSSFSFGDWQGNRWWGDFWNLVIHLAGPRLSCTPLHKALPKSKSRGFRLQGHADWHTSNYTDIGLVLTINTHTMYRNLESVKIASGSVSLPSMKNISLFWWRPKRRMGEQKTKKCCSRIHSCFFWKIHHALLHFTNWATLLFGTIVQFWQHSFRGEY